MSMEHMNAALESIAAVARELKKERDEARQDCVRLAERLTALELSSTADLATLERERDEAREEVLKLKAYGVEDDHTIDRLLRERDDAREALSEIALERDEARARIEIIKPPKNNPVAEFFSSSRTPETDAVAEEVGMGYFMVDADFARKLERERDKTAEDATNYFARLGEVERERDEAIRQRDETNTSSKYACDYNYEQKLKAERERDEARERLHKVLKVLDGYDQAIKNPSSPFWEAFKKWFTWEAAK